MSKKTCSICLYYQVTEKILRWTPGSDSVLVDSYIAVPMTQYEHAAAFHHTVHVVKPGCWVRVPTLVRFLYDDYREWGSTQMGDVEWRRLGYGENGDAGPVWPGWPTGGVWVRSVGEGNTKGTGNENA